MRSLLALCGIIVVSAWLRYSPLTHSFWVDEFSTAYQAKLLLEHGVEAFSRSDVYIEHHNILPHILVALSFWLFEPSEAVTRMPFFIIGILLPAFLYLGARKWFGESVAWSATLLSLFSYWQITWSQQARGYMLQQLFILGAVFFYLQITQQHNKVSKLPVIGFILCSILGVLTHTTYLLVLGATGLHMVLFHRDKVLSLLLQPIVWVGIIATAVLAHLTGLAGAVYATLLHITQQGLVDNTWYYHSFLWREHTLITFLAVCGVGMSLRDLRERRVTVLLMLIILAYVLFVSFIFPPYTSRYILPIFPLLLMYAGKTLTQLASLALSKKFKLASAVVLILAIIANGDTFTIRPKPFYSVNHAMREIALLDYTQVYDIIIQKGELAKGQTAVIDTWPDRMHWYLGGYTEYTYVFRWLDEPGLLNGLPKITRYQVADDGTKFIPDTGTPPVKFIGELSDLILVLERYEKGFIWIDDQSMSREVIEYAQEHFHQELYIDRYEGDDNPYSVWPGTLYSWGFNPVTTSDRHTTHTKLYMQQKLLRQSLVSMQLQ